MMAEIDDLRKRFIRTYDEEKKDEEIKDALDDEFLKDEMQELLKSVGVETDSTWTKDDLSDRMISKAFYEELKAEVEKEQKSEVDSEEEDEYMEDIFSPSKLLRGFASGDAGDMEEFWESIQKEVQKGFKDFRLSPQKYWKDVEELWKERSRKFQKSIEALEDTKIPQEEVDELNELWKAFVKEMNLHLSEIPIELKLKKDNILDIIKDHSKKSRRMIANPNEDIKDLYPLWFDMIDEIKKELEETREFMEDREEMVYETWDEFKEDFTDQLTSMAVEYAAEMEDMEDTWSSISEDIEQRLAKGFEKHDHLYEAFWKTMGKEKPMMFKKFEELREKMEKDYTGMIEKALDSVKEGYEDMLAPGRKEKEKEIDELKERIEELEKKLEEK